MAWDENVCANTPAPEFTIPEDESLKDQILDILGYEEQTITTQDEDGNEITVTVLVKKDEATSTVCEAIVCESVVGGC